MRRQLAAALLIMAALAFAPHGAVAGPDLAYRRWTAEDGLPQNSVYAFAQTPEGYLWIATLDGLVRFDGVQMTVFDRGSHPEMGSNRCLSLHTDRHGALWIGTEDGGVMRKDADGFRTWAAAEGVEAPVSAFLEDDAGVLWIQARNGILRRDGERWVQPHAVADQPGYSRPGYGFAWVRRGELRTFECDGGVRTYAFPDRPLLPYALWWDAGGAHWLTVGEELYRFRGGVTTRFTLPPPASAAARSTRVVAVERGGRLWVLRGDQLSTRTGEHWTTYPRVVAGAAPFPYPLALFADREGSLWIGGDPGVIQARPTPVQVLVPPAPRTRSIFPLLQDPSGRVWAGTQNATLSYAEGRFETHDDVAAVGAFHVDADGSLLAGTDEGLLLRRAPGGGFAPVHVFPGHISDIARDGAGTLWVATWLGLWREQGAGWRRLGAADGLADEHVRALLPARDGALWVGTYGGLSRVTAGHVASWTERDGLSSNRVRALLEDAQGVLWVGTYDGGLTRFDGRRFTPIRRKDGLFDNGVFAILDDRLGRYWMSSNRGIYAVTKRELDDFAEGRIPRVSSRAFGKADGMRAAECNGGRQPAGFRHTDGTLWFPTQDGIAVVDPRAVADEPAPPRVLIESVATEGRSLDPRAAVVLGTRERSLEVRYTAMTLVRAEQVRFRHRLEPLEHDWTDAGPRRIAHYSAIPPGAYVLHLAAAGGGGPFGASDATLAIRVTPAAWQTGWFRGGALLLFAAVVFAGHRVHIARLKRRRAEQDAFAARLIESQEAERKRIAGELHDGIGQTLVVIRNRALMGLREGAGEAARARHLQEISSEASAGIDDVRKIAYNLRPYQLDRLGLERALEAVVEQAAGSSGIAFETRIAPLGGLFARDDEINVYRIVQEAVSNLVRHAGAAHGRVAVEPVGPAGDVVEIAVEDDGRGFDPAGPPGGRLGHGLQGIAERARLLGGQHAIRSVPGEGTRLVVRLPARRPEARS